MERTPRVGGVRGGSGSKNQMVFRTQRTLSENILMIFDLLAVQFWPQKKLLVWAKNSLIFCSKLPRSQKWRYQEFLLHQKMAKEGSKNQKKFFFRKNIRKMGKKNWGTSGTIFAQNRFWGSGGWVGGGLTHGYFPREHENSKSAMFARLVA